MKYLRKFFNKKMWSKITSQLVYKLTIYKQLLSFPVSHLLKSAKFIDYTLYINVCRTYPSLMSVKMKKSGCSPTTSAASNKQPKVSEMVLLSIAILNERNGSSIRAIKKYISKSFNVEEKKISSNVKKYVRLATASGTLVQTKGKGAAGSFRLGGCMKYKMSELLSKLPDQTQTEASSPCDTKKSVSSDKSSKKVKMSKSPKRSSRAV